LPRINKTSAPVSINAIPPTVTATGPTSGHDGRQCERAEEHRRVKPGHGQRGIGKETDQRRCNKPSIRTGHRIERHEAGENSYEKNSTLPIRCRARFVRTRPHGTEKLSRPRNENATDQQIDEHNIRRRSHSSVQSEEPTLSTSSDDHAGRRRRGRRQTRPSNNPSRQSREGSG